MAVATNRTAGEFLSQYLEISGFNGDNGAFMVCKEFLDNAVDACSKATAKAPRFPLLREGEVELEVAVEEPYLSLTCRDTGVGIDCESVAALGEVFSSSKANDEKTGGEFGIGLKAIMLYSKRDLAKPVNVKMRMNENEVWTFGMILSGASSTPEILNFSVQNLSTEEWGFVTEFSLKVSSLWDAQKEAELEAYCAGYTIWRDNLIRVRLAFRGEKIFRKSKEGDIYSYCINNNVESEDILTSASVQTNAEIATIKVKAELQRAETAENDDKEIKEIILLRSFNGMPLLPTAASACLLTNSLRFFLTQYGQYFGIDEFSSDLQTVVQTATDDNLQRIAYRFRVQTAKEPSWGRITLAVDIRSNKSLFCSFAKSHLQGETSLRESIVSAYHGLFNQLQKKFPQGFQSMKDIAKQKATEVFAPSMAASLAGIICSSLNPEFQTTALNMLNLNRLSVTGLTNNTSSTINTLNPHAAKRAKTRAANEIIQDRILELLLSKIETADCSVQRKAKKTSESKRRKSSPILSPSWTDSLYSE